jgi:LysM repeat protein
MADMRSSAPPPAVHSRAGRSWDKVSLALAVALAFAAIATGCQRLPGSRDGAPPPAPATVEYRAKPGDTVERIAAWHGVEAKEVRRLNDLDGDDELAAGRRLRIPSRPLARHRVSRGETLGRIGQRYGTGVEALIHLNDVADVRKLQVGQEIRIPANAARPAPPAAQPAARATPATPLPRPVVRTRTESERMESQRAASERAARAAAESSASSTAPARSDRVAPPPARAEVDRALLQASRAFDAADFDRALATAERAQRLLPADTTDPADRRRLARAHLLAGMANVALGRRDEARRSLRAALSFDETIRPDAERASPTVAAAFRDAQEQ